MQEWEYKNINCFKNYLLGTEATVNKRSQQLTEPQEAFAGCSPFH